MTTETTTRKRAPIIDPGELTPEIMADSAKLKAYAIAKERFERHSKGPAMRREIVSDVENHVRYIVSEALTTVAAQYGVPVKSLTIRLDKNGNVIVKRLSLRFRSRKSTATSETAAHTNGHTPKRSGKAGKRK